MRGCKLLLAVTLPALEQEINRMLSEERSARLLQAFFVHGTGFIGAVEYEAEEVSSAETTDQGTAPKGSSKSKSRK